MVTPLEEPVPDDGLRLRLLQSEKHILSQVAAGVALPDVLKELIIAVEAETDGQMWGSILLVDEEGKHLQLGAAPHLPEAFNRAVDGLAIAEGAGSCGTAAHRGTAVFVTDIATDPLWAQFLPQTLPHGLRACWSIPIRGADGRLLGTFGNYYRQQRSPTQHDLEVIAFVTQTAAVAIERHRFDRALTESEERFRTLVGVSPQMVWLRGAEGEFTYCNRFWQEFTGLDLDQTRQGGWLDAVHPSDRSHAAEWWANATTDAQSVESEIRFRRAGDAAYRYFVVRGTCIPDSKDSGARWIGVGLDIHERKQAEEARELLTRELSHRIKNIFAVVTSLASLASRRHLEAQGFVGEFRARLLALSTASEYVVRPRHGLTPEPGSDESTVLGLVDELLAPYTTDLDKLFEFSGDDMSLGESAATALALSIHELATNAVKYGALSSEGGHVRIEGSRVGDLYRLTWSEVGGPTITGKPDRRGFGTELAARFIEGHLGGTIEYDWAATGLNVRLSVPLASLIRGA